MVVLLDGPILVDLVFSSGLWPLDEVRRSTLGVATCDEMEETFHYDVREGIRPKPYREDIEEQVLSGTTWM
jgi:hypothetical protein